MEFDSNLNNLIVSHKAKSLDFENPKKCKIKGQRKLLTSVSEVSEFHNDKIYLLSTVSRNERRKPMTSKEAEELVEIRRKHFRQSRFPLKFSDGYEIQARR